MKIFIVCNSLGSGGAERVGANLANGFIQHGHQVYIVTDINRPIHYPVEKEVQILPFGKKDDGKIKKWLHAIINIRKYAHKEQPDIIMGITNLPSFVAKLGVTGMGIPVILTIHHAVERIKSQQLSIVTRFYDQHISKIYKYVAVLSNADKEFLHNRKGIFVMPNPVSFSPAESFPQKEKIVIAAGQFNRWHYKGFDILIKAWAKLAPKYPEWKLQLAGTGPQKDIDYIQSLSKEYNVINRMDFLGFRKDIHDLFNKASIFVLSSRSEGLPMVLIEAMSQGCAPVATSNLGRTRDIITSENEGIICEPEDVEGLASGMERLIDDEAWRQLIQHNAIERSKFYALDNIINMWEELFKTIS